MHSQIFGDKDYGVTLPLSYWGGYLNFSAWLMENVLFEQMKVKV
jgi:hypothetical protein